MKEELLTTMIQLYGFEHPAVIQFAEIMNTMDDYTLVIIVNCHVASMRAKRGE